MHTFVEALMSLISLLLAHGLRVQELQRPQVVYEERTVVRQLAQGVPTHPQLTQTQEGLQPAQLMQLRHTDTDTHTRHTPAQNTFMYKTQTTQAPKHLEIHKHKTHTDAHAHKCTYTHT